SGRYFDGQRQSRADAQAYEEKARRQLRALSLELTGHQSSKSKEQHS
ncbi:3-oxoacyl-ACP reductase, partial [Mesorhizobium sp. M1C.F.Ca.ET.193.01.1.1]